jgi:hypothetical protein
MIPSQRELAHEATNPLSTTTEPAEVQQRGRARELYLPQRTLSLSAYYRLSC